MLLWSIRLMGTTLKRALIARSDYDRMLHYIRPATEKWKTQAYTCSAVTKDGLDELWDVIQEFAEQGKENGVFLKTPSRTIPPLGT